MASFIAGLLTVCLVINCALLVLLVLIQLPKKDAGVGLAFGGGAADALFGAGSGNVLTKITKWAVVTFFVLALILGYLEDALHSSSSSKKFENELQQKQMQMPPISGAPPASPAPQPAAPQGSTPGAMPPAVSPAAPPPASTNVPGAPTQSQ